MKSETQPIFPNGTQHFFDLLDSEMKAKACFRFEDKERLNWHYFPKPREGVRLGDLNGDQLDAFWSFVETFLSPKGIEQARGVIQMEGILGEIEDRKAFRDPGKYYISFFTPADQRVSGVWGWRLEGHHLSLNYVIKAGEVVAMTPAFFGTNPAIVRAGPHAGMQVLAEEENTARALARSLDGEQRRRAIVSDKAPADILSEAKVDFRLPPVGGIAYNGLNEEQQSLFRDLVSAYLGKHRKSWQDALMDKVRAAGGWATFTFAWAGGTEPGEGHYYRIQGPRIVIEYNNTQNGANHVHSVLRDSLNDFGRREAREYSNEMPL